MLCNICGQKQATVHLTEIVNNQMIELHLCESCAQEKAEEFKSQFSFNDILAGLADFTTHLEEKAETIRCAACGLTYEGFRKSGRLGCAQCYQSFSKQLMPLIKRVQGATQHIGKSPGKLVEGMQAQMEIRNLQEQLKKLIEAEEFEEAAKMRDQIKKLEAKAKRNRNHEAG